MLVPYRWAICNELFGKLPFDAACAKIRELGYEGIEIAPFTLTADPQSFSASQRAETCRIMSDAGLEFIGLHWLMLSPNGLHVTTPDEALRKRSWEHFHRLIDLCADLSGCKARHNGVMVFGSPNQRSAVDGMSAHEATDIFTHELAHAAPHAESRDVRILVEALPQNQTNVVNCLADAVAIVRQIGSPAVQTMFDTHNAVDEKDPHPDLIRKYFNYIQHVHVNEMDGREPGTGSYDFTPLLTTLADLNYQGWISLEVFDLSRDPEQVARNSLDFLQASLPSTAPHLT